MKVLLLRDHDKLGKAGDIKNVADGYARNYLLPRGLAVLATAGALKQAETIRKSEEKRRAKLFAEAQAVANQLTGTTLDLPRARGRDGQAVWLDHGERHCRSDPARKGHRRGQAQDRSARAVAQPGHAYRAGPAGDRSCADGDGDRRSRSGRAGGSRRCSTRGVKVRRLGRDASRFTMTAHRIRV